MIHLALAPITKSIGIGWQGIKRLYSRIRLFSQKEIIEIIEVCNKENVKEFQSGSFKIVFSYREE